MRLSICIATMNRAIVLVDTLESITSQLAGDVEIVIVDGSSDAATKAVAQRFAPRVSALRYEWRKPSGVDRDYAAAVALSSGDYCWLFTDDDLMRAGALTAVVRAIAGAPDCIVVNAEVRDATLDKILDASRLKVTEDRTYTAAEFEVFARVTLEYLSFIGGLVIRRALWDLRDKERYFGSEFIHVGVLFQKRISGHAVVLATPYIAIRYGVAQWTRRAFRIWMINWPRVIWSFEWLSGTTKAAVIPAEPWRSLRQLFWLRAKGAFSHLEYVEWLQMHKFRPWHRLAIVTLTMVPVSLANRFGQAYLHVWRPHAKSLLLDLVCTQRHSLKER